LSFSVLSQRADGEKLPQYAETLIIDPMIMNNKSNSKRGKQAKKSRAPPVAREMSALNALGNKIDRLTRALPKGTFSTLGTAAGGAFGPTGALVGGALGKGIAAITGRGDYEVRHNSIATTGISHTGDSLVSSTPQFRKGNHSVRVAHREYVSDVLVPPNPVEYSNSEYTIQPSNASLFPWLSALAKQYQQYRIHGMVVEFRTNTSDYSAAGPMGVVGIATNYNVADLPFPTLVAFENSEFAVVTKPSNSIMHAIECAPQAGRDEWLYVRDTGSQDPNYVADKRFSDFAKLQVMSSGLPGESGNSLGQLWVSYDIEFCKPIVQSVGGDDPIVTRQLVSSNADGSDLPATASSMFQCSFRSTNPKVVPSNTAQVTTLMNLGSGITKENAALLDALVDIDASNDLLPVVTFKKSGRYTVTVVNSGITTPTSYSVASLGVPLSVNTPAVLTKTGAAEFVLRDDSLQRYMAHACSNTSDSLGFYSEMTYNFDIGNTYTAADTVEFYPSSYTSFNTTNATLYSTMRIKWIASQPALVKLA